MTAPATARFLYASRHGQTRQPLTGAGGALADLFGPWIDLLRYERFRDLTGNGISHPNDSGHRLCAQVLLELLLAKDGSG